MTDTIFNPPTAAERAVGRALRDECQRIFGSTWSFDNSWRLARVAIEAMREPTKEMLMAGESYSLDVTADGANEIWHAMIEAALATAKQGGGYD